MSLVFGVRGLLAMRRLVDGAISGDVALLAAVGVAVGVVGLVLGPQRGVGRRVAVMGTGVSLLGLALYWGAIGLEAVLDSS
ncbi:hypothetical protein BH24ACT15_BH24ACT15_37600 [soil metagenome]|jgi:hypothetical protein